jgi:hypothetical protein
MKKTKFEREAYALRRLSRAVDRAILSTNEHDKAQAKKWAALWSKKAGL